MATKNLSGNSRNVLTATLSIYKIRNIVGAARSKVTAMCSLGIDGLNGMIARY